MHKIIIIITKQRKRKKIKESIVHTFHAFEFRRPFENRRHGCAAQPVASYKMQIAFLRSENDALFALYNFDFLLRSVYVQQ